MTDFLQFLSNRTKLYKPVVPVLDKILRETGENRLVDLGSGGGGGLLWVGGELLRSHPDLQILMTDLYPNLNAFEYTRKRGGDHFDYVSHPVDAVSIPKDLKGIRTQFLSLHHFKTDQVCAIFQNAIDTKCSIAIFEGQERSIPSVLAMLLSPLSVWLTTPFIRPFKIGRIIFTYLIPLVPIFVLWDGVVSAFRTYSVKEMEIMVESLNDKDTFEWQIGRLSSGPGVILYLTGRPKLI